MFFNEGANVHKNFDFYGILREINLMPTIIINNVELHFIPMEVCLKLYEY